MSSNRIVTLCCYDVSKHNYKDVSVPFIQLPQTQFNQYSLVVVNARIITKQYYHYTLTRLGVLPIQDLLVHVMYNIKYM